jgi:hypothetical protein
MANSGNPFAQNFMGGIAWKRSEIEIKLGLKPAPKDSVIALR